MFTARPVVGEATLLFALLALRCAAHAAALPLCSRTFCAASGARAACAPPSAVTTATVCAVWPDACARPACPTVCDPAARRPVASDGVAYCTLCSLRRRSCRTAFRVVGPLGFDPDLATTTEPDPTPVPVPLSALQADALDETVGPLANGGASVAEPAASEPEPEPEPSSAEPEPTAEVAEPVPALDQDADLAPDGLQPVPSLPLPPPPPPPPDFCTDSPDPEQRVLCCTMHDVGCAGTGRPCSPHVGRLASRRRPHQPCKPGVTCVVTRADRLVVSGECVRMYNAVGPCSVERCGRRGVDALCAVVDTGFVATCAAWAARTDGGYTPFCRKACDPACAPDGRQPVASDGRTECSVCQLLNRSCESGFKVWGPVIVDTSASAAMQ